MVVPEELLRAPFAGGLVVYDPAAATTHVLESLGAWIMSTPGSTTVGALVSDLLSVTGGDGQEVTTAVLGAVAGLDELGLLGHREPARAEVNAPRGKVPSGPATGSGWRVLDQVLAITSSDADLKAEVEGALGLARCLHEATMVIDVEPTADGGVVLDALDRWEFPSRTALFHQLPAIIDELAVHHCRDVVVRAGAVRTPDGRVVVLMGSKSARASLIQSLVYRGCDVLGHRSLAVGAGRAVTGSQLPVMIGEGEPAPVDLGPDADNCDGRDDTVDLVVVLGAEGGPPSWTRRLDQRRALGVLLGASRNLVRVGDPGLVALCELAETVACVEVDQFEPADLAAEIIGTYAVPAAGELLRGSHPWDSHHFRVTQGVEEVTVDAGSQEGRSALVRRAPDLAVLLDPFSLAVWEAADGQATLAELITTVGGAWRTVLELGDIELWHRVLGVLAMLVDAGLVDPPVGHDPSEATLTDSTTGSSFPDGPWSSQPRWLFHPERVRSQAPANREDLSDTGWYTNIYSWPGGVLLTDAASVVAGMARVGVSADGISHPQVEGHPGSPPGWEGLTVSLRTVPGPGAGSLLQVSGHDAVWIAPGDEVGCSLALVGQLLLREADTGLGTPLAPVWVRAGDTRCLWVSGCSSGGPPDEQGSWSVVVGAWLGVDGTLRVPRVERVEAWLEAGATGEPPADLFSTHQPVAFEAPHATSVVDAAVEVVENMALDPWSQSPYLGDLVGDEFSHRLGRNGGDRAAPSASPEPSSSEELAGLVDALGGASVAYSSCRVTNRQVVTGRPLLRLDRGEHATTALHDEERTVLERRLEADGLGEDDIEDLVRGIESGAQLHVGEEIVAGGTRRKYYLSNLDEAMWRAMAHRWAWVPASVSRPPSWLAWKATPGGSVPVARTIEVPYLDGADRVGDSIAVVLGDMPASWADCVGEILARSGIDQQGAPGPHDLITYQDDGRVSLDLPVTVGSSGGGWDRELRWLVAVAGHPATMGSEVVAWMASQRLARIIFGTGAAGAPLVNLYTTPLWS